MSELARRVEALTTPEPINETEKVQTTTSEIIEKQIELGYIKDLFKLGESANHFQMPQLTKEIDDFILSEIDRQGLEKTRKSYEEIIDGYLSKLHLPDGVDNYTKVEKVTELVRINRKLIEAMEEKEALLNGDPTQMTSSQLKRYIKEKL